MTVMEMVIVNGEGMGYGKQMRRPRWWTRWGRVVVEKVARRQVVQPSVMQPSVMQPSVEYWHPSMGDGVIEV